MRVLTLILIILVPILSNAQDSVQEVRKLTLSSYIKDMQSAIFDRPGNEWITASQIHNRLNFRWQPYGALTVKVEMRNRIMFGDLLVKNPSIRDEYENDPGLVTLSRNLAEGRSYLINTTLDRVNVDLTLGKFQVTAGRQRINWGQTFSWNPNDIFNQYNYFDFDYEEKPGSDAIRIQYFNKATSRVDAAVKADHNRKVTAALLHQFNYRNYDFQAFGGIFNSRDLVLGAGWSGQLAKGGFRGEITMFRDMENRHDTNVVVLASAGYDYTFGNSVFLDIECLYNGNNSSTGISELTSATGSPLNAKNPFLKDFSFLSMVSYPFTPLFNGSVTGIVNPSEEVYALVPTAVYSLSQNADASFIAQVFYLGKSTAENWLSLLFLRFSYSF